MSFLYHHSARYARRANLKAYVSGMKTTNSRLRARVFISCYTECTIRYIAVWIKKKKICHPFPSLKIER